MRVFAKQVSHGDGDVALFHHADGGEIEIAAGLVQMSGGLPTAVYLSLFGGNEDHSGAVAGGAHSAAEWWGNILARTQAEREVSRTQHLLQALPAVSANLARIHGAVVADLRWLLDTAAASSVEVVVGMPAIGKVQIDLTITALGVESSFSFTENWKAAA